MATYCPEDISSRELSCPICFEDYDIHENARAPKLLLCLHTFCLECTRKLWQADGTLECSLCRMIHEQVTLDDLFDNPVIVQYLRQESERRDLDLARRIDEEMRRGECVTSVPDIASDIKPVSRWEDEAPKTDKCSSDSPDHQAQAPEVPVQSADDYSRDNIIINFFDELMENISAVRHEDSNDTFFNQNDNEDEDEDEDEDEEEDERDEPHNETDEIAEEIGPHDEEEEEEEDDMVDTTNPAFSLRNIQALFGQIDEDPASESDNSSEGDGAASSMLLGNFFAMIGQGQENDNEEIEEVDEDDEEEDEEEEEERWHSASDELNIPLWPEEVGEQMNNRSEVEESDLISGWQIVTPESFLDE